MGTKRSKRKTPKTMPKANNRSSKKPARAEKPKDKFLGRLKGIIEIVGDLEEPLDPPEAWEYD
jgi:hypothetical protein